MALRLARKAPIPSFWSFCGTPSSIIHHTAYGIMSKVQPPVSGTGQNDECYTSEVSSYQRECRVEQASLPHDSLLQRGLVGAVNSLFGHHYWRHSTHIKHMLD